MSTLSRDLDKFLKTNGLRILIESGAVRQDPSGQLVWTDPQEEDKETPRKDE